MKTRAAFALLLLATTGCQQSAASTAEDVSAHTEPNAAIIAAAEPFEKLTEQAATADWPKLDELVSTARSEAGAVRPTLPSKSATTLDHQLATIAEARQSQDRLGIALAAVEGYRTMVEAQDPRSASPPIPVSLLDYAGFRYGALARSRNVDWQQMAQTAAYAREQWAELKPQVNSAALSDVVSASISAMEEAAMRKDAAFARSAATTELALVDVLEEQVARR